MSNDFTLYGILDTETGKLVSDLTNPRHKYWEKKESAESTLASYKYRYSIYGKGGRYKHNANALKVVTIKCIVEE